MDIKKLCLNVMRDVVIALIVTALLCVLEKGWRWMMSVFWIKYVETMICFLVFGVSMFLWAKFCPRFSYFSLTSPQNFHDGNQNLAVLLAEIDQVLSHESVKVLYGQTQGVAFYPAYVKLVKALMKKTRRALPDKNEPLNKALKDFYSDLYQAGQKEDVMLQKGKDKAIDIIDHYDQKMRAAKLNLIQRYPVTRMRFQS